MNAAIKSRAAMTPQADESPTAFMTLEERQKHDSSQTLVGAAVLAAFVAAVFSAMWAVLS